MHRLYIFSIIMNYRDINTIWDENEHFLQPSTSNQLRIFVSQWTKLYVHIDNKIVYRKPEALLQNIFYFTGTNNSFWFDASETVPCVK